MATQIPALSSCVGRMTSGERVLAERLQQKLEDDYLLWWDVPVGPLQTRPDFIIIHPQRGALILETKDWRLDTIKKATREYFEIIPGGTFKIEKSPLQQARHGAVQVVNALERDPQLVQASGNHTGKLAFPWGHGVVFTRITRQQFNDAALNEAIPEDLVICSDEMTESVDAEAFQQRLWNMFPYPFKSTITLPQLDRIRWTLFPEVRIPQQSTLFGDTEAEEELPDIMRVMDLQQEQLARSLGDGHRVIHGVAGSGKTMILGYRAEHLAQTQGPGSKPILVLCYNKALSIKLASTIEAKGLQDRVHVRNFHKWCRDQLVAYNLLPAGANNWFGNKAMHEFVQRVIKGVDDKLIPSGQYHAVPIDEGHDFAPEWLKLVTQMVDPNTNSLLLLYDDAQNIYDRGQKRGFSLKSIGIQAQGRTTILKINYRNTRQILHLAHQVAGAALHPEDAKDEDRIPLLKPLSSGREGPAPIIIDLPSLSERATQVAAVLADQHAQGHAWGEMAVLCRNKDEIDSCAYALKRKGLPHQAHKKSDKFNPAANSIQIMTLHASKGLEWPVVAVVTGDTEQPPRDAEQEARLIYVGTTRAPTGCWLRRQWRKRPHNASRR
ncbi:MAG: 3'-5' exonuclease [Comamonas sp.]